MFAQQLPVSVPHSGNLGWRKIVAFGFIGHYGTADCNLCTIQSRLDKFPGSESSQSPGVPGFGSKDGTNRSIYLEFSVAS